MSIPCSQCASSYYPTGSSAYSSSSYSDNISLYSHAQSNSNLSLDNTGTSVPSGTNERGRHGSHDSLAIGSSRLTSQINQHVGTTESDASATQNERFNQSHRLLIGGNASPALSLSDPTSVIHDKKRRIGIMDSREDEFLRIQKKFEFATKAIKKKDKEKNKLSTKIAQLQKKIKEYELEKHETKSHFSLERVSNVTLPDSLGTAKICYDQTQGVINELQTRINVLTNELQKTKNDVVNFEIRDRELCQKNNEMQAETLKLKIYIEQLRAQDLKSITINRDLQAQVEVLTSHWQKAQLDISRFQKALESQHFAIPSNVVVNRPPHGQYPHQRDFSQTMSQSHSYPLNTYGTYYNYTPSANSNFTYNAVSSQVVPQDLHYQSPTHMPLPPPSSWASPDSKVPQAALVDEDVNVSAVQQVASQAKLTVSAHPNSQ